MAEKLRISHLDGLRGIAILWVIAYHAYSRWFFYTHLLPATKDISLFKYGFLGVSLFFMISGFVIFMTLDKSANFFKFIGRRWLRLFPGMLVVSIFIYLTSTFFFERPHGQPSLITLLPGFVFISPDLIEFFTGFKIGLLEGSFWSLYVEMIFYVIIGFIYFFIGRKYCIIGLFIVFLTSFLLYALTRLGINKPFDLINILGFPNYGWFIIGCVVYEAVNKRNSKINIIIALLAAILIVVRTMAMYKGDLLLIAYSLSMIALFVISFYSAKLQSLLSSKLLLIVGFASYPLYLIHENMIVASIIKLHNYGVNDLAMYFMPILITIMLTMIAYCIAKYIEPTIKNKIQKIIKV